MPNTSALWRRPLQRPFSWPQVRSNNRLLRLSLTSQCPTATPTQVSIQVLRLAFPEWRFCPLPVMADRAGRMFWLAGGYPAAMSGRDRPAAGRGVLSDRACLVALAVMVLSCDQGSGSMRWVIRVMAG